MRKTVQIIPDKLFFELLRYSFGTPFTRQMVGLHWPTLIQPVKIDGQSLAIGLNRDRHVATFFLFKDDLKDTERPSKKDSVFTVYAGKCKGFGRGETFKNRIYFDASGKVDPDQQQTFLHPTMVAGQQLDIIIRNLPVVGRKDQKEMLIAMVPVLEPIPLKLPLNIKDILLE